MRRELADAIAAGRPVGHVLERHGLRRGVYYQWLRIGRGQVRQWFDGCPIDEGLRQECLHLAMGLAVARCARAESELSTLRASGTPTNIAPLHDLPTSTGGTRSGESLPGAEASRSAGLHFSGLGAEALFSPATNVHSVGHSELTTHNTEH